MSLQRPALSPRQKDALEFIERYVAENKYPPTMDEIAKALGITSKSTAHGHVQALHRKGYIEIAGPYARSLQMRVVA